MANPPGSVQGNLVKQVCGKKDSRRYACHMIPLRLKGELANMVVGYVPVGRMLHTRIVFHNYARLLPYGIPHIVRSVGNALRKTFGENGIVHRGKRKPIASVAYGQAEQRGHGRLKGRGAVFKSEWKVAQNPCGTAHPMGYRAKLAQIADLQQRVTCDKASGRARVHRKGSAKLIDES